MTEDDTEKMIIKLSAGLLMTIFVVFINSLLFLNQHNRVNILEKEIKICNESN